MTKPELDAHMEGAHGWTPGAPRIMPGRVLRRIHDRDHEPRDDDWPGSPDSSRSPRFIARSSA